MADDPHNQLIRPPTVALLGPTASGKSDLARRVALASSDPASSVLTVELVSVDSMAVYRGMDIGTAKPSLADQAAYRYHVIDIVDPSDEFTVQQFQTAGNRALAGIAERGHAALLVGGTGLYLRSLVDDLDFPGRFPEVASALEQDLDDAARKGDAALDRALVNLHDRLAELDPVAVDRIAPSNRRRLVRALEVTIGTGRPFSSFGPGLERYPPTSVSLVGIRLDPVDLDRRITDRFEGLMELGFLDEVRRLVTAPGGLSRTARQAIGYRELLAHLEEGIPLAEAVEEAVRRTRAFARRQMAWFERDPRILWVEDSADPVSTIISLLAEAPRVTSPVGDCSTGR
jgi:tRNA dimethylallyltransferase